MEAGVPKHVNFSKTLPNQFKPVCESIEEPCVCVCLFSVSVCLEADPTSKVKGTHQVLSRSLVVIFRFHGNCRATPKCYAGSLGIQLRLFDVSVCFGTSPKVKVKEALHRITTFRVPGNFQVALECSPKVFLQGSLIRNTHFSGWPPLGLYNIKSNSPDPEITFIGHVAFMTSCFPAFSSSS